MSILGDLVDETDYSIVKTGYWVNRFDEDAENIEVVALDSFGKVAYLTGDKKMGYKELVEGWTPVQDIFAVLGDGLPGADPNFKAHSSLLGALPKEGEDEIIHEKSSAELQFEIKSEQVEQPQQSTLTKKVMNTSPQHDMIANAIAMSTDQEVSLKIDTTVQISFDINKIKNLAEMMSIPDEVVIETLLASPVAEDLLKALLKSAISK